MRPPHAFLHEVAQKAILTSPEVKSKWHNLKAAEHEIDFARGGFLPKVDVTAGTGYERLKQPPATTTSSFHRNGLTLTLNQMLFDGFATYRDVRRLDKARLVRYYELLDASENTALEAVKAYFDVMRFRFMLDIAEDNYIQHRATFEQMMRRVQSGVGRRVDLEQAASRLALAEVNLTTEEANLHDVTARYQRLLDEMPPKVLIPSASLTKGFPKSSMDAIATLYQSNPALLAAQENVESATHDLSARRAAFSPRVDFRARRELTSNYTGLNADRVNEVAEVVLTYNIFNGGSDLARSRQYVERKHIAADLRDKACRDTRQTLLIAFNDVKRLAEQVSAQNRQVDLLQKTRDAYRDQYNVGQRTLLDLLDTENELMSARRSAINSDVDLSLAYLRTHAGMGTLLKFMGLQKMEVDEPAADELSSLDLRQVCSPEGVTLENVSRDALNARAMALIEAAKPATPPAGMTPGGLAR